MRICVCGIGRVGKPLLDMFRKKGFEAIGYDMVSEKSEANVGMAVAVSDCCVFMVQTPSKRDGSFDDGFLRHALAEFHEETQRQNKPDYLYIVSSTTMPGQCESFREIVGDNLCYKPEFIRLAYVRDDLLNPYFFLIGEASKKAGDRCEEIYKRVADCPIKRMSLTEAELAKITLNCALTMKVSLANQLHLVAEKLGANSSTIMEAVGADPRIGRAYLNPGWPFSGPCLPRDNRMFHHVAAKAGIDACLSEASDKINAMVVGVEREGWSNADNFSYQSCTD